MIWLDLVLLEVLSISFLKTDSTIFFVRGLEFNFFDFQFLYVDAMLSNVLKCRIFVCVPCDIISVLILLNY